MRGGRRCFLLLVALLLLGLPLVTGIGLSHLHVAHVDPFILVGLVSLGFYLLKVAGDTRTSGSFARTPTFR
jgi:hypothetical protein